MKITLLHPSRSRAHKAHNTFLYWMDKLSNDSNIRIEHILSLDESDTQVEEYKNLFKQSSTIIVNDNTCVVEATNHAARQAKGDILIYLSDDFLCPKNWDLSLVEKFKNVTTPMLVKVDDCLQKFDVAVLTIPIMNKELYKKLGYFWHPEYKSLFVDEDLYWVCKENGWLTFAPELKFEHLHCSVHKSERDETYIRSEQNWDSGKAAFAKRKEQNFPLENKMILSILIPTLKERELRLNGMVENLTNQISKAKCFDKVEVLIDDRGKEITTGEKRNDLIAIAQGKYTWFVDDDDYVFEGAIEDIMLAAEKDADTIVFNGYMTTNDENKITFELRLGHDYCSTQKEHGEHYLRFPNHIVPMKLELIKDIKFEHISNGEDYRWALQINDLNLLKTQEIIDKDIYHYKFVTNK